MIAEATTQLIRQWREDEGGTYQTWFLWEERVKNFRSIRRGIQAVVQEIDAGTFGNVYKGSSLEVVVGAIAEQRQIFKGVDHAFLWKPKLRIPDIYEDRENQLAFARFLNTCTCCSAEAQLLAAITSLDAHNIKGLGPAAANLLYFLHPTVMPPFNTAIVRGYNLLTGARVKLGRWSEYLAMRNGILRINAEQRSLLSNDLGAVAGLLFDIGSGRYTAPPLDDAAARIRWQEDLARVRQQSNDSKASGQAAANDRTHTEVQAWLRDLGIALGYRVWIAANDRNRAIGNGRLCDGCLNVLPPQLSSAASADTVALIDCLWIDPGTGTVSAAFEVEHSTSIYSGIVRMLDLALGAQAETAAKLFLVAPDAREKDVRAQLLRPAFSHIKDLSVAFIPYSALQENRQAMMRFGHGMRPISEIAKTLVN